MSKKKISIHSMPSILPTITPHDGLDQKTLYSKIIKQLKEKNAVIIAHYYVDHHIQDLAEDTNGIVSDSLEMARFGNHHSAPILIIAGVRFMGETAKILSPDKTILMPDMQATCSLDYSCPADDFSKFCQEHPDRKIVVYANTSARVKSLADWVVTSSSAPAIIQELHNNNEKILWASDQHLGRYLAEKTGADMILWNGSCIVHSEFNAQALRDLITKNPQSKLLAHPESPQDVLNIADFIGSTTQIITAARQMNNKTFIIATESGVLHKIRKENPEKIFWLAPTQDKNSHIHCTACSHCPWMKMNSLAGILHVLETGTNKIEIDHDIIERARKPIERMLKFMKNIK